MSLLAFPTHFPVTIVAPDSEIKEILDQLISDTELGREFQNEYRGISIVVNEDKDEDMDKREKIIDAFFHVHVEYIEFARKWYYGGYGKSELVRIRDIFAVYLLHILKINKRFKKYGVRTIIGEDAATYFTYFPWDEWEEDE